jgi:hypothetical protein
MLRFKSPSRADQVQAFLQNVSLGTYIDSYALSFLQNATTLNLAPDTPINRFRLMQRYALATLRVPLTESEKEADKYDWSFVTCTPKCRDGNQSDGNRIWNRYVQV